MVDKKGECVVLYQGDNPGMAAIIRGLSGTVPYIGPMIGEALTINYTKVREERLREAFDNISEMLMKLGEDKIDKDYVRTEDFQHLLIMTLESALKSKHSEKRKSFARILTNALSADMDDEKRRRAEWFAETLGRMSYYHILAFNILMSKERDELIAGLSETDKNAVFSCLSDLKSAGFVIYKGHLADKPDASYFNSAELTEPGREFVRWALETDESA